MLGHFDEIYRRLERLDQEYLAITQALRRIEARLTDEQGRREIVERDLADLKQHVAALQARIAVLEQRLDALDRETKSRSRRPVPSPVAGCAGEAGAAAARYPRM